MPWLGHMSKTGSQLSLLSLEDFVRKFERIFDRPNHAGCASDRLFSLRQGERSVAEYAIEFGTLAAESGWNELALLNAFRQGLSDA